MFCKNCGSAMSDNQAVCMNCGERAGNGNGYCANCGGTMNPETNTCTNCGAPALNVKPVQAPVNSGSAAPSAYLGGRNKKVMALICAFLGGWGVHNFMLGDTKKGIVKLVGTFCCCGITSILVVFDMIEILAGTYTVEPDKYF